MAKIIDGRLQLLPSVSALFRKETTVAHTGFGPHEKDTVCLHALLRFGESEYIAIALRTNARDDEDDDELLALDPEYQELFDDACRCFGGDGTLEQIKGHPGWWFVWIQSS
jgi:hypothetical protein